MIPRDPAVDAILTAETLFAQFLDLVPRLKSLLPADVSIAMGEARNLYPELWAAQNPCDVQAAERRVALFQANHRGGTARKLARKFLDQCGENAKLKAVADSR